MAAPMVNMTLATAVFPMSNPSEEARLTAKIMDQYFNSGLTVLLPGKAPVPNAVLECLAEQMSYSLRQLPLYRFLEMPFIKAFLKQGSVYALSQNTSLLCHDCVAVTPSGWLILHLTKDTYQELGLEAMKQTPLQKKTDVYVVKINLLSESFKPGRKGYERVLWCLKDRLNLAFNFMISWVPKDVNVCSSSVAVYFSDLCKGVEKVENHKSSKVLTSLPCPRISADHPHGSDTTCSYQEVFEWMGAVACDINLKKREEESDTYVSSFFCPEPCYNVPRCSFFQVSGFLTPETICKILHSLKEHSSSHDDSLPTTLTVHGFLNSPLGWKTAVREFYTPGDNLYSVLLLPDRKCWFMTAG